VTAEDPVAARQAADAARMHLVDALVENGLPADRALRLAAIVQRQALASIEPGQTPSNQDQE
jgi:hypothetical protein